MKRAFWLIFLLPPAIGGCFSPEKASIVSDDPSLKIPAFKEAAAKHDESALQHLVKALNSDDAAVRLYAINTLREITGTTLDYRYYDDELQRLPALKRWQDWLAARQGTTQPATTQSTP